MQGTRKESQGACPVCFDVFRLSDLNAHCNSHFGASENEQEATRSQNQDKGKGDVFCTLGCGQMIPQQELESHEAAHRLQEEESQVAQSSDDAAELKRHDWEGLQASTSHKRSVPYVRSAGGATWVQERLHEPCGARALNRVVDPPTFANICEKQQPASFVEVKTGLIELLRDALASQEGGFQAALSGPVHHFHAGSQDAGWGCGWNNIQMLSSHLLQRSEDIGKVLFGGCGFTPDISSLQAWLACAWQSGFDTEGAAQLGCKIQGTRKWVGTTEAAAILRLFGIRAHVVDFKGHRSSKQQKTGHPMSAGSSSANGQDPMPIHKGVQCDKCGVSPIQGPRYDRQRQLDHSPLLDWVWHYFTGDKAEGQRGQEGATNSKGGPVILSGKPPLYFQHEGHSRTIVGIEKARASNGQPSQVYLLILDPSHATGALDRALRERKGWQRLIKRSMGTLQKREYQLLHCSDGLATGAELEDLKIMRASEQFGF